jgi:hypothetical protein
LRNATPANDRASATLKQENPMMKRCWLVIGTLCFLGGLGGRLTAEESTLLARPQQARLNVAASPKFDDRVFVYCAEPITGSILEHRADVKELVLNVGAKDGVRFGHAFRIVEPKLKEWVGVAKVMELDAERSVAKVVSLAREHSLLPMKGFTTICTAPKSKERGITIQCAFGKDVWQTESFENKLIRGLLDNGGKDIRILIRQESTAHALDAEPE